MSTLVLVLCLAASVAGSALVRMERSFGDDTTEHCGAPSYNIPHGGIKLFPVTDFDNSHDDSCQINPDPLFCEYKFYCDDGYSVHGNIHLECVAGAWEGDVPTCVEGDNSGFSTTHYVIPGVIVSIALYMALCCVIANRRNRRRAANPPRCSNVVTIQTTSAALQLGRSLSTGGTPGYERFDDSNKQVPRDGTPSTNGAQGATTPSVPPPPYICPGEPAAVTSTEA